MLQHSQAIEWHGSNQASTTVRREYRHPNLERLVCAAISNAQLAETLLGRPEHALRIYQVGRDLSDAERRMVLSVAGAADIYEFAGHLHAVVRRSHDSELLPIDEIAFERTLVEAAAAEPHPALAGAMLVQ